MRSPIEGEVLANAPRNDGLVGYYFTVPPDDSWSDQRAHVVVFADRQNGITKVFELRYNSAYNKAFKDATRAYVGQLATVLCRRAIYATYALLCEPAR